MKVTVETEKITESRVKITMEVDLDGNLLQSEELL